MARNAWFLRCQADLLGLPVEVARERETTALGAAALAGLAVGIWTSPAELAAAWRAGARYESRLPADDVQRLRAGWRDAVRRAL
jgi:glycerol kinase